MAGKIIWKGEVVSEQASKSAGLSVLRPGVCSTLQDLGRYGVAHHGLSQGGAMDLHAHCWANKLLGNSAECATLEMAVGMVSLRAESDLLLAITGADMQAEVNGLPIGNWCSFRMQTGQTLALKPAREGMRAYLAVLGGFQSDLMWGSRSTVVRNGMGSLLSEGETLWVSGKMPDGPHHAAHVPSRYLPSYEDEIELRVMESCQAGDFSSDAMQEFYRSDFTVTPHADRMGMRLEGKSAVSGPQGIVSEGIALGAIQVPADGHPIVLLNDRQTLGGYPKLGVIARVDLPRLCQARPGTRIRFSPVSIEQARQEWRDFCDYFLI